MTSHAAGLPIDIGADGGRTFGTAQPAWDVARGPSARRPNVIVMIMDNMGYSDLGCFGSEIETPNLDRLADEGIRLANFHTTPSCAPSRAALLTGMDAHAVGVGSVSGNDAGFAGYRARLAPEAVTMAESFRDAGYATFAMGKWHLTTRNNGSTDRSGWPVQRGFERFYGFLSGIVNYHAPAQLVEDNHPLDFDELPDDYYITDDLTDRAIDAIRLSKTTDPATPFFLYFAHAAPHVPLHCKPGDLERYRGRYDAGWTTIREERFRRQQDLGLFDRDVELPPPNTGPPGFGVRAWDDLSAPQRELYARYMECYAAIVDNVDQNFGRLRAALEDLGEWDETIVVFLSDHGPGCSGRETGSNHFAGGVGSRLIDGSDDERDYASLDQTGGPTTFPDYPTGWSLVSSTPFRMFMVFTYNGGHTVPCIVRLPDAGDQAGTIRRHFAFVTDLAPTLRDLVGISRSSSGRAESIEAEDGVSLAPILRDPVRHHPHDEQYFEIWGQRALYRDGWTATALHLPNTSFADDRWELHDVTADPTQAHDLGAAHPERLRAMIDDFDRIAGERDVYPLDERIGLDQRRPPDEPPAPVVLRPGYPRTFGFERFARQRSFSIQASLDFAPGDAGVVVSQGSQLAGFVVYVEDDLAIVEYNAYGPMSRIASGPLSPGERTIDLFADAIGGDRWRIALAVDGATVAGAVEVPMLNPVLELGCIDVGIARLSPVSWDVHRRHGTFRYTGHLRHVRIAAGDLAPDRGDAYWRRLEGIARALQADVRR